MKEAYYFSHDSNTRGDEKIIALMMKHKWAGYGIFWGIIEKLRDSTNYMSVCDYNLIAYDLRVDTSLVKSIIEEFGLFIFTDCGKYFYSNRLNKTMEFKETKSKKASESALKRWEKCEPNANALRTQSDGNAKKEKESKRKEKSSDSANAESSPSNLIQERIIKFGLSLKTYEQKYTRELLTKFYKYWTEPNKSGTKFRAELEKTWDVQRRLETWASREKDFVKQKPNEQSTVNLEAESFDNTRYNGSN
jgi:Domain of unknown function (DUF4373)